MLTDRSTLEAMRGQMKSAICPEEIFGKLPGPASEQLATLRLKSRSLARACHPDLAPTADKRLATEVFQALNHWEEVARQKVDVGTYGDFEPHRANDSNYEPIELVVRGKRLTLTGLIAEGTFASIHHADYETDSPGDASTPFVKYARDPRDNDLLEREHAVLKAFGRPESVPEVEDFFKTQRLYAPHPITSFFLRDENDVKHRANLLTIPEGECYTAATLRQQKFPDGIEPKHVWWIFRRLLLTIWMSHLKGYVHGAVTPDHVLIYPQAHGLVLLDWTCAAQIGEEYVPAINPTYCEFYPPEVARKELAEPTTDIYMATATALYMLGGDPATGDIPDTVAPQLAEALRRVLNPHARYRPQDAELFHNEFGKLLGKRTYSHMVIP